RGGQLFNTNISKISRALTWDRVLCGKTAAYACRLMRRGRSADTNLNSSGLNPPHATATSLAPAPHSGSRSIDGRFGLAFDRRDGGRNGAIRLTASSGDFQHNAAVAQASVAKPLLSTTTSRSTTRARNETRVFSGQISVRIVSPG